jgi:hypothetical protein
MPFWNGIFSKLQGDAQLTALLGAGPASIFYGRMPAHTAFPYVHIWSPGGSIMTWNAPARPGGAPFIEKIAMQCDCYAETPDVCLSIGKRVATLLDFSGTITSDDSTVIALYRQSVVDEMYMETEVDELVNDIFHITVSYEVWNQKSLVAP